MKAYETDKHIHKDEIILCIVIKVFIACNNINFIRNKRYRIKVVRLGLGLPRSFYTTKRGSNKLFKKIGQQLAKILPVI